MAAVDGGRGLVLWDGVVVQGERVAVEVGGGVCLLLRADERLPLVETHRAGCGGWGVVVVRGCAWGLAQRDAEGRGVEGGFLVGCGVLLCRGGGYSSSSGSWVVVVLLVQERGKRLGAAVHVRNVNVHGHELFGRGGLLLYGGVTTTHQEKLLERVERRARGGYFAAQVRELLGLRSGGGLDDGWVLDGGGGGCCGVAPFQFKT